MPARPALLLVLLCLLLRGGEVDGSAATPATAVPTPAATAPAPAATAPAAEAAAATSAGPATAVPTAPASAATQASPPAAAPAPVFETVTIANDIAELVITTQRGAIVRFALRDTHPVHLPKPLRDQARANGLPVIESADREKESLAVLGRVLAPGYGKEFDNLHNWVTTPSDPTTSGGPAETRTSAPLDGTRDLPWRVTARAPNTCTLELALPEKGLVYALTYTMDAMRPLVSVRLTVRNTGAEAVRFRHRVVPFNGIHQDYPPSEAYYLCACAHTGGKDGTLDYESFPNPGGRLTLVEAQASAGVDYAGLVSRFFAAWWRPGALRVAPDGGSPAAAPASVPSTEEPGVPSNLATPTAAIGEAGRWSALVFAHKDTAYAQALLQIDWADPITIRPGERLTHDWQLGVTTFSDAHYAMLDTAEKRLAYTDWWYRFFRMLADVLTWCLNMIKKVVVNYGLAVIVLTLLIKLALHRTSFRQQASMQKMAKLAPELKALQEQYGNDRQKMAMKQMELWKKHDVNPLRGCLPILIQMPIFMALYQTFNHSAEMRGAGFLWVKDLTLPDVVFAFTTHPWFSWLTVNPLPLIYIAVTVWMSFSMKMPPNPDPQQEQMQKMMRWMPVVFGVIFYTMPAGLVLYFTANAILSTLETKYIKRKLGIP